MKPHPAAFSIACALTVLAGAAMLDLAKKPPMQLVAERGDRIDVAEAAAHCGGASLMAACADAEFSDVARMRARNGAVLQLVSKPGETIAMRVALGE